MDREKEPRYLKPEEVAVLLRISLKSFYKRAWKGDIPVIKLGGSLRVDRKMLEEYLKEQTRGPETRSFHRVSVKETRG